MKLTLSLARLALALSGLTCAGATFAADDIQMSAKQSQALGIETAPLAAPSAGAGNGLPAQVTIPPAQMRVVSTPLAGLLESVAVAVSEPVKKGQVLARLQSPGLVEQQRELLQASTQAQLARDTLSRDEKLFKEGIIAESRYLAAKGNATTAGATLAERRQALRLAGMSDAAMQKLLATHAIGSTIELVSPLDGVVLEVAATVGQRAEAAAPLFKIARLTPLWLEIQVPIAQAGALRPGATVEVPAYGAAGRVLSIGRSVSEGSQTVMVRAEIREGAQNLRPGQFVEANVATAASDGKQWSIPNAALVRHQNQTYVFVQTPTGYRVQPVKLLGQSASGSIVNGGLKGDERIVIRGASALKGSWQGVGGGE